MSTVPISTVVNGEPKVIGTVTYDFEKQTAVYKFNNQAPTDERSVATDTSSE